MRLPRVTRPRSRVAGRRSGLALLGFATAAATTAAVMAGGPAAAAQPEGEIRAAGTAEVVADSFIVVLKNDNKLRAAGVDTATRDLAARYGGKVRYTYRSALQGFAVNELTDSQARRLAADRGVLAVHRNGILTISATQANPPSWGLDRIDQRRLPVDRSYQYPTTASNVSAYVIDTGVLTRHNDFGGRAVHGRDTVDNDNDATDCHGHGTHVAGTVGGTAHGVAKGVRLVAVRVLSCQGSGTNAGVIAGVDWVTQNAVKPAVANMSLGGGANAPLDTAVSNSIRSGISYALAAGNGNAAGVGVDACTVSPARTPDAITVGATDSGDARARFSNFGRCVDIFAPGVGITSTWIGAANNATNTISGTSMASPHVAGAAALVVSANPSFTPQQVRDHLVNNATPDVVGNPGPDSPNKLLYVVNDTKPVDDFSVSVTPAAGSTPPGEAVKATVDTAVVSGSPQQVALRASGLPAGASATLTPATVTAGGSSQLRIGTRPTTPPGSYPVTITGTGPAGSRTATFTLTVTGSGGGNCSGTNDADVAIPDWPWPAVTSPITISDCNRNGTATSTVEVHIKHPARGDLRVELQAPDGTRYLLKPAGDGGSEDDLDATVGA